MNLYIKSISVIILLSILGSGCVSKKDHAAALASMRSTNENVVNDWQKKHNAKLREIKMADDKIRFLELDLAERKGENNILVNLRNELQLQIAQMESQMTNLGSSSKTVEQTLRGDLSKKDGEIRALQQKLAAVNSVLDKDKSIFNQVYSDITQEMQSFGASTLDITTQFDRVVLTVPESMLFEKGSSSRLTDSGKALLERVTNVMNRNPLMLLRVTGHTDNTPANVKRYKDNLNFSALQSAAVVRSLVGEFDMNTSQVAIAAKGEYEPLMSNSTSEGKYRNRRVEFVVYKLSEDMAKQVRGLTGGF